MPAPYFILAEGKRGSKVPHHTIEGAKRAAAEMYNRLTRKRRILILETIETIYAEHERPLPTPGPNTIRLKKPAAPPQP